MRRKRFRATLASALYQWKKIYKSAWVSTLSLFLVITCCLIAYLVFSQISSASIDRTAIVPDYGALHETHLQKYAETGDIAQLKAANFYLILFENKLSPSQFYGGPGNLGGSPFEGSPIELFFVCIPLFSMVFSLYWGWLLFFSSESVEEKKNALQARMDLRDFEKGKLVSYLLFVGASTFLVLLISLLIPHKPFSVYANEKGGYIRSTEAMLWIHIAISELWSLAISFVPLLFGKLFKKPLDYGLFLSPICLTLATLLAFGSFGWRALSPFILYFGDFSGPEEDLSTLIRAIETIFFLIFLSIAYFFAQRRIQKIH